MGIVARQSFFSTILLYIGAIIGYINLLYFFPRFLSTSEIGTVRTIQDMAALFVPIAQLGLTQSLIRFFPKLAVEKQDRASFLTFILLAGVAGYLVFFLLFHLFESNIEAYFSTNAAEIVQYFPIVLAVTFLLLIYNLLVAYSHSLLKTIAPNFIRDVLFRVSVAVILLAYFTGWVDFEGLMYLFVAAYGIMMLSILSFLAGQGEFKLSFKFHFLSGSVSAQIMVYALYSLLGASGMLIIGKIDSIMVTGMLGTSLNGIYTTVFYIAVVIELPKRAINQISLPLVSRAFETNDIPSISKLYNQSSVNQLIIGCLLLIGIWINLENIFAIMPNGTDFEMGKWVVIVIGLGRIFDMAAGINSEIIIMSKYFRFNMVLLILLAVFTILLNYLLIPTYGITGAAAGSAAALVLFNLSKFIFIWWKLKIQPFSWNTISILALSAGTLLLCLWIPTFENPFIDIGVRSLVAVVVFGLGILILKPSQEITALLKKYLRN